MGFKPRLKMLMERDRDERECLNRWLTGRRFLYIEFPSHPLPPRLQIGPRKATLYHFEQKAARQQQSATCSRQGRTPSFCESDIVCRECRKPGHNRGDPACPLPATLPEVPDDATKESVPMDNASDTNLPAPAPLSQDAEQTQTSGTRAPRRVM